MLCTITLRFEIGRRALFKMKFKRTISDKCKRIVLNFYVIFRVFFFFFLEFTEVKMTIYERDKIL